jgi:adenine-specific DNA-methyltransferase
MTKKVDTIKHKDKRSNIPTQELRGFVSDEEKKPRKMLYPRDPSLDPQLVWKGKDEQDENDLEVPVVPIYIQEKIHPQSIISAIKRKFAEEIGEQPDLFADFDGLKFEELIEFYEHKQNWTNRMILGDSLLVMTGLAEKEALRGKVQCIYFDPPYGINFGSNWQVSTRKRGVRDGNVADASREPEVVKAFRDTWQLGVHSYLTYLRDRLVVGRELLADTGSIFVQIGNENVHRVRCLLDEIFGEENFCGLIDYKTTSGLSSDFLPSSKDYICWYAKDRSQAKFKLLFSEKEAGQEGATQFKYLEEFGGGEVKKLNLAEIEHENLIDEGWKILRYDNLTSTGYATTTAYDVELFGKVFRLPAGNVRWKTTKEGMGRLVKASRVFAVGNTLSYKRYIDDFRVYPLVDVWTDTVVSGFAEKKVYVVQTSPKVAERCVLMTTDPGDLVLDPTCGSGTTAYVAEKWGRRWITIDTSRVALALARTRLMSARYPYYLLADSPEGVKKEAEITGQSPPTHETNNDVRRGFVYERIPHIRLRSIANNSDIENIYDKWQEVLEPIRIKLNKLLGRNYEEWEIPRRTEESWTSDAKELHGRWWDNRRKRQAEIDAVIARHADHETLFDRPYEDSKRLRVSGPFTVESLSPHRVLAPDDDESERGPYSPSKDEGEFVSLLIDYLRKSPVQTGKKKERLKLDRLEPFAGMFLHAEGDYTDDSGQNKRVAVVFGPEHGTVGTELIKEAAKEAVAGIGYDVLLVCGFAFDPHVYEEVKRYPKPTVLAVKMNPDLAMGDDLLKKTGSGNLFMTFGEPDISPVDPETGKVLPQADGKIRIKINGVDVYDPTTGQIRSNSVDDIACWFIDTDYDEESFFVRHAYFTGTDKPFDNLKNALRADINEEAWAALYSTESKPFDPPEGGKIAVKVINHYGDEVLRVFEVGLSR